MRRLLFFLLLLTATGIRAQVERFVSIDPVTGGYAVKSILPGVHWIDASDCTTLDSTNRRYYFRGGDSTQTIWRLYGVDLATGAIVSSPLFPQNLPIGDNVIELHYSSVSSKMYALHWDNAAQLEYFVSVDPLTGLHTIIDTIPNITGIAIGMSCLDDANGQFVFVGVDTPGNWRILTIDVTNGNVISNPQILPTDFAQVQFDPATSTYYGLHWDNSSSMEYLVSINRTNGTYTNVGAIPNVYSISCFNFRTFDMVHHRLLFQGLNMTGVGRLYNIDVTNGSVYANPLFYVLPNPQSNLIELQHEAATDTVWGLNWDAKTTTTSIAPAEVLSPGVAPNPFTEQTTVQIMQSAHAITVRLYDMQGKLVRTATAADTRQIRIPRENLPAGFYTLHVLADEIVYRTKLVITD